MGYELLDLASIEEYREYFESNYCDPLKPVLTFDDIWVRFFPDMFDHAFFKSARRREKDKSLFSEERAVRMGWIRTALEDPNAVLKIGWDKESNSYDNDRRVAFVNGNYVVIIVLVAEDRARFITAYVADNDTIKKILEGPDWAKK